MPTTRPFMVGFGMYADKKPLVKNEMNRLPDKHKYTVYTMSSVYMQCVYDHGNAWEFKSPGYHAIVIEDKECQIHGPLTQEAFDMITIFNNAAGAVVGLTYERDIDDIYTSVFVIHYEQGHIDYVITLK